MFYYFCLQIRLLEGITMINIMYLYKYTIKSKQSRIFKNLKKLSRDSLLSFLNLNMIKYSST